MKPRPVILMLVRMVVAYVVCAGLLFTWPGLWLNAVEPFVAYVADASCPYIDSMKVSSDDAMIELQGRLHVEMTHASGKELPPLPVTWQKHGGQTLNVLMIAVAIWAAPAVRVRRRLLALPVILLAAAFVASIDLAAESQTTALRVIGTEWLPGMAMAPTDANKAAFQHVEQWYQVVQWLKAFMDGGGRLFMAVTAGLVGYALPVGLKRDDTTGKST